MADNVLGGFDPWEELPARTDRGTRTSPVEEQLPREEAVASETKASTAEPSDVVVMEDKPKPVRRRKRAQEARTVAKEPQSVSEAPLPRKEPRNGEIRVAFRCDEELRGLIEDGAWYATEGDMSDFMRAAARFFLKYLITEHNGGKPLPKAPSAPPPAVIDRLFLD